MARSRYFFTVILACSLVCHCDAEEAHRSRTAEDGTRNWTMFNPAVSSIRDRPTERTLCGEDCVPASSVKRSGKSQSLCPEERRELCLVLALSRIAKVQVADYAYHPADRESGGKAFRGQKKSSEERVRSRERMKGEEGSVFRAGSNKRHDGNVHCRATRDVYIPEAKKMLPAYMCKLGGTTFLLSSTRFLEDRKSQLDINVEHSALQDIDAAAKVPRSNEFNVVPALLVLRNGDSDYRVRTSVKADGGGKAEGSRRRNSIRKFETRTTVIQG